jgi:hypothetical protein
MMKIVLFVTFEILMEVSGLCLPGRVTYAGM